jgi:hypothetical protein
MQNNVQSINKLLPILKVDFPEVTFHSGTDFMWSPKQKLITYNPKQTGEIAIWALLHELAHAELNHATFEDDLELLQIELEAWKKAKEIGIKYKITIDNDHIEDCLDTYRDWLHSRATCPSCGVVSLQLKTGEYRCFNCKTLWKVPKSQVCRVSRRVVKK